MLRTWRIIKPLPEIPLSSLASLEASRCSFPARIHVSSRSDQGTQQMLTKSKPREGTAAPMSLPALSEDEPWRQHEPSWPLVGITGHYIRLIRIRHDIHR